MPIERMDKDHEEIVRANVEELIIFLDTAIPRSKTYSHINMSLNVLTGALVTIAHNFVDEKDEPQFIKNMILTLQANFDANRAQKREKLPPKR